MKSKRKMMVLTIEYADVVELQTVLRKVALEVNNTRMKYNRDNEFSAIYEWYLDSMEEDDYREELINGVWCQIYESNMNNNE